MIIIHKTDDFLFNLFPKAKEAGKSFETLKDELGNYYTFGPYKPKVEINDDVVKIYIDTSAILSQKPAFDTAIKYCESGNFKKAKPVLEKLVKNNPTVSEYHRVLGQIYSDEGRQEEAINCLIDALRWDPKNTHALTMMGNIFAKSKNDIETAMTYYEQALKVRPDDHIAMNNIGANLMQLGRVTEAESYFEKAYSINSNYPNTIYAMGIVKDIKGEHLTAFDYAIQSLKKSKVNDPLYRNAFQLASEVSRKVIVSQSVSQSVSSSTLLDNYSQKLAVDSGKITEIIPDNSIATPAELELAENYNRDKHIVKFKKDFPAVSHLIMHELAHLDFAVKCRKKNANYLFVTTKEQKERFIRENEAIIQRLNSEGIDENSIADFINSLFSGMNSQTYNTPVDLFIEDFLYKAYPDLRPFQFTSLYALLQEYIKSATSKKIIEYTPAIIRNANIILSLMNSFQFKDLYGYETGSLFKASQQQMKTAKGFYEEYQQYQKNDMALEAHQLIQEWAKELKIENYFTLVEENEYRSSHLNDAIFPAETELSSKASFPLVGNQSNSPLIKGDRGLLKIDSGQAGVTADPTAQAAVTMYCLSALQYFQDKDLEEIKRVGFEIAMLGRQGIDPAKTDRKYHLKSIPGKEFTGLQLLAYMYSAFQVIDPFLDTGLNFKKEYEAAKEMFEKGK
jgi:Tfp pilus assembly protein PilF